MSFKVLLALGVGCTIAAGTACASTAGLAVLGRADPASRVTVEVSLPLRHMDKLDALLTALHDPASPSYHMWLTPAQFGQEFGPDPALVDRVVAALSSRGFTVERHTQSLHLSGNAALAESTFGMHLLSVKSASAGTGRRLVADAALKLPAELAAAGATVMSFAPLEAHVLSRQVTGPLNPANRYGQDGAYWYDDLKQAYQYPSYQTTVTVNGKTKRLDGTGATIGVLMSSDYLPSDITAVFDHENWTATTGKPDPVLFKDVAVNGGGGLFGGAFAEVSIDTQQEIGGAPGAHVILYDIPDLSDGNIFAGYVTAIEYNEVDLISSSFGECELEYFPAYNGGQNYRGILAAQHQLFLQGNAQGITFLASSGDSAGKECPNLAYNDGGPGKFIAGIEDPADDPNVTAVGGTNLVTQYIPGSLSSVYATENAWSDPEIPYDLYGTGFDVSGGVWGAGGGYSKQWALPSYQALVDTGSTKSRSTPDVGMQVGGCPGGISILNKKSGVCDGNNNPADGDGNTDRSAIVVAIAVGNGGGYYGYIGTSVSSPEFAGAMALLIEQKGRMGNLNTYLYRLAAKQAAENKPAKFFRTGIPGFNGLVQSNVSATYSVSTGVGTPIVKALVGAPDAESAGIPQSASNP